MCLLHIQNKCAQVAGGGMVTKISLYALANKQSRYRHDIQQWICDIFLRTLILSNLNMQGLSGTAYFRLGLLA